MINQNSSIPLDKQSRPMKLLAAVDLPRLCENTDDGTASTSALPRHGVLKIFVSADIEKCQPKDKNCFKIVWEQSGTPTPMSPQDTAPYSIPATHPIPATSSIIGRTVSKDPPHLDEARAICAFSANGITYNDARAKDDCYSHLMTEASNWNLVLDLQDNENDYLLLLHKDHLAEQQLERAWLVRFKRNS